MSTIQPTRRTLSLLVLLSIGHLLLISAQVQTRSGLPLIESIAFNAFAGVHRSAGALAGGLGGIWTGWIALHGIAGENEQLRQRVAELEGRVMGLEALARETRALEEALGLSARVVPRTLAARVIAGNPTPGQLTVLIDRGRADGVEADMAVIAANGVVGRVMGEPTARAARVQLLVESYASAAAALERSGAGGLAGGGHGTPSSPAMRLDYVPDLVDVQVGERVFTSGQDGIYPPGFLIGTVRSVSPGGQFRAIVINPAVEVSRLDLVLVVLDRPSGPSGPARPDGIPR
ncbi:MAG TPA: rod shape-determining protein MreC [Vicinamibacterales bacterium]|nr:rod shape-determining protein MreC [Vicinamibacterales bacterium]